MSTDPLDPQLLDLGKRFLGISIQATNAYGAEQAKLQLERVLSAPRLSSEAGTQESLADIGRLETLTAAHKHMCGQIVTAYSAELARLVNGLPEAERNARIAEHVARLNWHMQSLSAFYSAREQWIDAARGVCTLMQSCRDTATFSDTVMFAEDDEYDRFEALMARIEAAHQEEVRLMNERMGRVQAAMAAMGLHAAGG